MIAANADVPFLWVETEREKRKLKPWCHGGVHTTSSPRVPLPPSRVALAGGWQTPQGKQKHLNVCV